MRKIFLPLTLFFSAAASAQASKSPCLSDPVYRQFDFWIGEWSVYGPNGKKAGDSKIELILDSCVILENWKSAGNVYAGKSFNTFNSTTRQWQQTWVDNGGGTTEYLEGKFENNRMVFATKPFAYSNDTTAVRRLSFYKLSEDRVRQHGEITKDGGSTWKTEYDLEYRKKKP